MNKSFKRVLLFAAVVCMFCALYTAFAATNTCVHTWVENPTDLTGQNDCTKFGVYKVECSKCDDFYYTQRLGHVYNGWNGDIRQTCTEPGMNITLCSGTNCKAYKVNIVRDKTHPATGHKTLAGGSFLNEEVIVADCEHPAGVRVYCTARLDRGPLGTWTCDYEVVTPFTGKDKVDALGHMPYTSQPAVAATCVDEGSTAEIRCLRCNDVLTESEDIPVNPNAHDLEAKYTIEASCKKEENGVGYYDCRLCDYETDNVVIPWAHNYTVVIDEVPATCKEDGWQLLACSVEGCGATTTEILLASEVDHTWDADNKKPADCYNPEMFGRFCTKCGYVDGKMEAVAGSTVRPHDIDAIVVAEATCKTPAGMKTFCKHPGCDYEEWSDAPGVPYKPALAHTPVAADETENYLATCKNPGWAGMIICDECGETIEEGKRLPVNPTAHDWSETATPINGAAPSCKGDGKDGFGIYTCDLCGATKQDVIKAAAAHNYVYKRNLSTDSTCGKEGTKVSICEHCGDRKEEPIGIYKAHTMRNNFWVDATCEEPDTVYAICSVCGETYKWLDADGKEVTRGEKLVHIFDSKDCKTEVLANGDCYRPAGVIIYCLNGCGETQFKADVPGAEPRGHVYATEETVPATCSATGHAGMVYCEECPYVKEVGTILPIDPTAHKEKQTDNVKLEADCITMTDGIVEYECEYCHESLGFAPFAPTHTKPATVTTLKNATCLEKGKIEYNCTVCFRKVTEDTPKGSHTLKNYGRAVDKYTVLHIECGKPCYQHTNTTDMVCVVCLEGFEKMVEYKKVYDHIWEFTDVKGDCTTVAGKKQECSLCGKTEFYPTDPNAVPAHTPKNVEDKAATCRTPGWTNKVECAECGTTLSETVIDPIPTAHVEKVVSYVTGLEPDCLTKKNGVARFNCEECGTYIRYGEVSYNEYGHNFTETADPAATCVENGTLKKYCTKCRITVTETLYADGQHTYDHDVVLYPDCVNAMRVASVCSRCGDIKNAVVVDGTEPLGHDYDEEFLKADCVNPARIKLTCANANCPEKVKYQTVTGALAQAALGHKEVSGDKAATCTEIGYEGRIRCEREGCVKGGVVVAGKEIPVDPNAHKLEPVNPADATTCTAPQKMALKCVNGACKYTTYGEYTKPHAWDTTKTFVDEDYTYLYNKCADCDAINIIDWLIEVCDHEALPAVKENEKAATCTEAGSYDEVIYCYFCEEEISRVNKTVEALGHTEVTIEGKAATCTEAGLTDAIVCSVCEEVLTAAEEIPALGHNEEELAAVEATCTETGLTAGKKCVVCGEETVKQEVVPALGHTEVEIPAVAADCTVDGLTAGKKCTVCGVETVKQEVVKAEGHKVEVVAGKAATCTEAGLTDGEKCSVCGEELKAQVEIPALGHTVVVTEGTPATCDKPGMTAGKSCSVCGEAIEGAVEIPALGHKYTVTWDFNADFTKKIKISTCDVCGEVVKSEPMDF